ncbi:MAG TPA: tetratricopeptide repeat protein [Thermohalobaculum sp.]|nr:tetratricopeptide repeat protein [Thermohalobaculum sp.]
MIRAQALELHRAGRLAEAEALYNRLSKDRPDEPDIAGLLGILVLQKGDPAEAQRLLRRALELGGDDRVRIRNLNALAVIYLDAGREETARAALRAQMPEVRPARSETSAEVGAMSSLASCALRLGEPDLAHRLADALEDAPPAAQTENVKDVALLLVRLGRGDALERLVTAAAANGRSITRDFWLWIGAAAENCRNATVSRLAQTRLCSDFPALTDPADPHLRRRYRVLVLNWRPKFTGPDPVRCYNSDNAISALARTNDNESLAFDTLLVKSIDVDTVPADLPRPNVVFNNLANAELNILTGNADRASRIAHSFGVPVLNMPAAVAMTTRERNYHRLNDIPDVVVPKTTTFFMGDEPAAFIADGIAIEFGFPVIVRSVAEHEGANLTRCQNRSELLAAIEARRGDYFYAIQYIDCPFEPGLWRKFRMVCLGEWMFGHKLLFGENWCVHSGLWRKLGPSRPDLQAEEARFLADPFGYLGPRAEAAIREIGRRTPLDYYGIDFTVDAAGRVLVFEGMSSRLLPCASSSRTARLRAMLPSRLITTRSGAFTAAISSSDSVPCAWTNASVTRGWKSAKSYRTAIARRSG